MLVFRAQLTKAYSLLGYGFEPRLNSLAHVIAGSVMIIGLSIKNARTGKISEQIQNKMDTKIEVRAWETSKA